MGHEISLEILLADIPVGIRTAIVVSVAAPVVAQANLVRGMFPPLGFWLRAVAVHREASPVSPSSAG